MDKVKQRLMRPEDGWPFRVPGDGHIHVEGGMYKESRTHDGRLWGYIMGCPECGREASIPANAVIRTADGLERRFPMRFACCGCYVLLECGMVIPIGIPPPALAIEELWMSCQAPVAAGG